MTCTVEREAEIDNARKDHEQQRQGQRELHERRAAPGAVEVLSEP
jgi:hypothetical protein